MLCQEQCCVKIVFMPTVTRPFRGVSADSRLVERRARLLDAALDEVGDIGVAQLRMNTVCKRARLTQRYFYEQFANRDELLAALFDQVIDEVITQTEATVAATPSDIYEQARVALAIFYDNVISDQRRARLYAESVGIPSIAEQKRLAIKRYSDLVIERVTAATGKLDGRSKARLLMAILVLVGGQADASTALASGTVSITRADYVDMHARMLVDAIAAASQTSAGQEH